MLKYGAKPQLATWVTKSFYSLGLLTWVPLTITEGPTIVLSNVKGLAGTLPLRRKENMKEEKEDHGDENENGNGNGDSNLNGGSGNDNNMSYVKTMFGIGLPSN